MSEYDDVVGQLAEKGLVHSGAELPTPSQNDARPVSERSYFDSAGLYRPGLGRVGYAVVTREHEPQHAHIERSFYVLANDGTVGWVPWPGSPVVWPWEAGWMQDMLPGFRPDPK